MSFTKVETLQEGNAYLFKLQGKQNYFSCLALGSKRNRTALSDYSLNREEFGHVLYNKKKETFHNVPVLDIFQIERSFEKKTADDLMNESKDGDLVYIKLESGEYVGFNWGECKYIIETEPPYKNAQEHADYIENMVEACGIIGAVKLGLTDKAELPPELKKEFEAQRPHMEKLVKSVHKAEEELWGKQALDSKNASIYFHVAYTEGIGDDDLEDEFPHCGLDVNRNTLAGIPIIGYKILDFKSLLEVPKSVE